MAIIYMSDAHAETIDYTMELLQNGDLSEQTIFTVSFPTRLENSDFLTLADEFAENVRSAVEASWAASQGDTVALSRQFRTASSTQTVTL